MFYNTNFTESLKQSHTKMQQIFGENKLRIKEANYKETGILVV